MADLVYFSKEASEGTTYFLGKCYFSWEILSVKTPHSPSWKEYLFISK